MSAKIRKGDMVQVMRGRDSGKRGKVMRVDPAKHRVWVEKINMISRHRKGVQGQVASTIDHKEAPLDLSNVMFIDPQLDEPTRVGFRFVVDVPEDEQKRLESEGRKVPVRKVRYAKKSNTIIEEQNDLK